jgi:dCMP deaminase
MMDMEELWAEPYTIRSERDMLDRSIGRQTWDETWLEQACVMTKRSRCDRAQVGAVIVAPDETVISTSYNGPPRRLPVAGRCTNWCPRAQGSTDLSPTYDDCPSAHAEANAIARADYSRMQSSTIYISTSPCKGCAKILANSGIVRVVFKHEDGREYRNPEATIDFLRECGIEVVSMP